MAEKYNPTPEEEQILKDTIVTYWSYGNRSQERAKLNKEVLDKLIALGGPGKNHWTLVNVRQWWKNHQKKYCPGTKPKAPIVVVRTDRPANLPQNDFVSSHMNFHPMDEELAHHPPDHYHPALQTAAILPDLVKIRPSIDAFPDNPSSNSTSSGGFDRAPSSTLTWDLGRISSLIPWDLGRIPSGSTGELGRIPSGSTGELGRTPSGSTGELGRTPSGGGGWDLTRGTFSNTAWDLSRNTTGAGSGLFADTSRPGDSTTKTGDGVSRENSGIFSRSPFSGSLSKWTSFFGYSG